MFKRIKNITRLLFVILLFASLFAYAMFQGGFVSWFLFFGFLPVILYSLLIAVYPLKFMKVTRSFSNRYAEAGGTVEVELSIKRILPLPIFYMIVEDEMPESIKWKDTKHKKFQFLSRPRILENRKPAKAILFPWFKRNLTFRYAIDHIPRGKHDFSSLTILTGDLLGIIDREVALAAEGNLYVRPWQRE